MECAQGFALQGGTSVYTAGLASSTYSHQSYPYATITVYLTGTTTLATIYADNHATPTPLSNPFTATDTGRWAFYAQNGRYDVKIASPALAGGPWTIVDMMLNDQGISQPVPPLTQTDVTAQRSAGTVYRNPSQTLPLWVSISWDCSGKTAGVAAYSGPNNPPVILVGKILNPSASGGGTWHLFFPVLPGNYYRCVAVTGTPVLAVWLEYQ